MIEAQNNTYKSDKKLQILNFYWDACPPCHSFMPIFIDAEKRYWEYIDFVVVNVANNLDFSRKYQVMSTPTIIVLNWEEIVFNKPWVPNWAELKEVLVNLIWKEPEERKAVKRKKFLWIF